MSGGGGGGAPSPIQGGEFLLQLLRNPPQQPPPPPRQPPQPQSQNLSHDPAVAAVGPSISFSPPLYQNNGHDHLPYRPPWSHSPRHFAPHNFFLQNPNPDLISSASPPRPGSDQSVLQDHQFVRNSNLLAVDDVVNLDNFGQNPKSISQVQPNDLMFGSLPFNGNQSNSGDREVGLGNRIQNGLGIEYPKNLELHRNKGPDKHTFVNHSGNTGWGAAPRRPPPGFSSNLRSFEENVSKGKSKAGEMNHMNVRSGNKDEKERVVGRRVPGERRLSGQFDSPGVPAGSKLYSASALDIEESQMELHSEFGGDDIRVDHDQLVSEIESLVLEGESADKDDKKKQKVVRDKEYRADKRGQWILPQRMRISKKRIACRSDIYRLNTSFLAIYESLIPSEEEKAKQKQLMALLEKHVNKEWPGARLYLYGSCANSFGFKKSDIDVCLAIDDTDVSKSDVLLKLASILESDNLQNVQALTRARVPIVKLMDPVTGISCDICVNNLLAVINTKLLRDYARIDGRLRQLAFIVKHWAKSRGVNETYQGTLSSYAYVLMCINFLQQRNPPILPCLQEMERTYAVTVDNAECAYFDQVDRLSGFGSQNRESIAQLVWAFFNYWAYYHDYTNEVISVRTGCTLSKHVKDWTRRVGNDRHLICIEDPFEITHDLGRVVDRCSIRVLREEFERAAEIMQYDPDPCVKLFDPYVPS